MRVPGSHKFGSVCMQGRAVQGNTRLNLACVCVDEDRDSHRRCVVAVLGAELPRSELPFSTGCSVREGPLRLSSEPVRIRPSPQQPASPEMRQSLSNHQRSNKELSIVQ